MHYSTDFNCTTGLWYNFDYKWEIWDGRPLNRYQLSISYSSVIQHNILIEPASKHVNIQYFKL